MRGIDVVMALAALGWITSSELTRPPVDVPQRAEGNRSSEVPSPLGAAAAELMWTRSGDGYDLFEGPEIAFNAAVARWERKPASVDPRLHDEPWTLIAIEPIGLQLVGYAGAEGSWSGVFAQRETDLTMIVPPGGLLPDLGWRLNRIVMERSSPLLTDASNAVARVKAEFSEGNGRQRVIQAGEPLGWWAVLQYGEDSTPQRVRSGLSIVAGGLQHQVTAVVNHPPSVEVSTMLSGSIVHRRWIHLRAHSIP